MWACSLTWYLEPLPIEPSDLATNAFDSAICHIKKSYWVSGNAHTCKFKEDDAYMQILFHFFPGNKLFAGHKPSPRRWPNIPRFPGDRTKAVSFVQRLNQSVLTEKSDRSLRWTQPISTRLLLGWIIPFSTAHSRLFLLWLSRHSKHGGETSKIGCSCCQCWHVLKGFAECILIDF